MYELNQLSKKAGDLLTATFIRHTMDTTDELYEKDQRWIDENMPHYTKAILDFNEAVYNSPYKDFVEKVLGPMYFTKASIKKKTFSEENILLRQREAKLSDEYQKLIAACNVEILGEPKNFVQLQGLFSHDDRKVRKAAFKAFSDFLKSHQNRMEEIWDELIKIRNQIGQNLGYDNYIPVAYLERERLDYGPQEVANFRKQVVEEIVPLCSQLYEAQRKRLGVDNLMVYDEAISFSEGNAKLIGDEQYVIEQLKDMLHDMSPETSEFMNFMIDHELIDYEYRPGKAAREYSTMLSSLKAPFIFCYFNGTASEIQNITGELGHAFASYRASRTQPVEEYFSSSADIMEIHSMSMTQFSHKYADKFFGEDGEKFRFSCLQNLMTFIPFGTAVDEFQHICYIHPELTPKERNQQWRKLEEKYMPWRKYDQDDLFMEEGGYWFHKHHFFLFPFYYIEYSLATINAMEMNRKYVEHPESAWKEFLALSDIGGSKGYLDILKIANLSPAYESDAVKKSISYVKDFLLEYINKHSD